MKTFATALIGLLVLVGCSDSSGSESTGPLDGESVAADVGCRSCHTEADTAVAPTWNGLWGSEVELEDGTTVTADAEYVRQSIEDPQSQIVAGYGSAMPTIDLSDEEIGALVDYIETLG